MEICVLDIAATLDPLLPILLYRTYFHVRFVRYEKRPLHRPRARSASYEIRVVYIPAARDTRYPRYRFSNPFTIKGRPLEIVLP